LVVSGAMLAGLVTYVFSLTHLPALSVEQAGTIAALLMGAGHGIGKAFMWFINRRWPPQKGSA
jgi:uncharacterized membrane protein YdcZ (DUF606 family)